MEKSKRCPKCHRLQKRSNQANARYWLLLHLIADNVRPKDTAYSAETWHTYFKLRYLGSQEVKMPNNMTAQIPKSSADLDTAEFNDYMMKVEVWAQDHEVYMDDIAA